MGGLGGLSMQDEYNRFVQEDAYRRMCNAQNALQNQYAQEAPKKVAKPEPKKPNPVLLLLEV